MSAEQQEKPKVVEQPQRDHSTGFDYRTHIKDAKSGKIIRLQHYAKHSRGTEVLLERPIGSGNMFTENGVAAGRWDIKGWTKISDKHVDAPQPPANRVEELEQHNEALQRELAALQAEREEGLTKPAAVAVQKK